MSGMVWDSCVRSPPDFEPGMFNLISLFQKGKDGFSVLEVERPWLLSVESVTSACPRNQFVFATGDGLNRIRVVFPFSALNVT